MKKKEIFCYIITPLLAIQTIAPSIIAYADTINTTTTSSTNSDLTIQISQPKKTDVVLTLGDTDINTTNFTNDLKTKLQEKGVDINLVQIQAIQTANQNLQSSFSWVQNISSSIGSIAIQNNGTKIQMYGNPKNAGFNKIYTPNNTDEDIKEQDMSFNYNLNFGDSFDGAGVLINTNVTNNLMNGYALFISKNNTVKLYQLTNWSNSNTQDIQSSSNAKALGSIPMATSGSYTLKMTKNKLTVVNAKTSAVVGSLALPTHYGWGLGFFSDHYAHGCNNIGQFALDGISLKTTKAKSFTEIIRQPSWRPDSERFVVNLENQTVSDFDNPVNSGEILTRLANEEINYVAIGSDVNKTQALNFIQKNSGNGDYINSSNYNTCMTELTEYIYSKIGVLNTVSDENPYILMGSNPNINVLPTELKTNTETTEFPNGRWKFDQDENFYDNNLGKSSLSGQYQKDLSLDLSKPGKHEITFGASNSSVKTIYVHRRPVADFAMSLVKIATGATVKLQDYSYDLDKEFSEDKGIAEKEWKWKETTSTTWNNGMLPETIEKGKNYIVQLRVKDYQGEWSKPNSVYVTTDTVVVSKPVSNFNVSNSTLTKYNTITIQDNSYDPAGRAIIAKEWEVLKNGVSIYKGATPITDFSTYGDGKYTFKLKIENDANLWSEAYSRDITVTKDITAPEAIVSPLIENSETNESSIFVKYVDEGGSGFKNQRYAISSSTETPTTGWSELSTNTDRLIPLNQEGSCYVHLESTDNEGNTTSKVLGPYKIVMLGTTIINKLNVLDNSVVDLSTQPKIDESKELIKELQILLDKYKGTDKDSLIKRLDAIQTKINKSKQNLDDLTDAQSKVATAENTKTQSDVNSAKALVYKLPDGTAKTDLQNKLKTIQEAIDNENPIKANQRALTAQLLADAQSKVSTAETTNITSDVSIAQIAINKLPIGTDKTDLQSSLDVVKKAMLNKQETDAKQTLMDNTLKLVATAESTNDVHDIAKAQSVVSSLPNSSDRDALQLRIDSLNVQKAKERKIVEDVKEATLKVKILENSDDLSNVQSYIKNAQIAIDKLPICDIKTDLQNRLDTVKKVMLDKQETDTKQTVINNAVNLVTTAENTKDVQDIAKAQSAVSALPNSSDRDALQLRIDTLNLQKTKEEQKAKEDQLAIDTREATLRVKIAEASVDLTNVNIYIKNAQIAIDKLPSCDAKTNLQTRLNAIANNINKSLAMQAEPLVKFAELFKTNKYKNQAWNIVNKMTNCNSKDNFVNRLNNIK